MVLADGCFDPLHIGHIEYLRAAASLGHLTVNIADDEAIRAKGREPFQSLDERILTLAALDMVDAVVSESLRMAIEIRTPTFLVKGDEWRDRLPADVLSACERAGTQIVYFPTTNRRVRDRI